MTETAEFPFAALAEEDITADWDACHRSRVLGTETAPENTTGMWVQLRSDSKEARAERKQWPKRLRLFKNLKCLSVNGCTPELLESICELPALRRLSIVRGRITDLRGLKHLSNLTHFYCCGNPRLMALDGIQGAKSLIGLSLVGNFENVQTLEPLANLPALESLVLGANDFRKNSYESLTPIAKLKTLRHLGIFGTRVNRDGLFPIGELRNLEYLYLDKRQLRQWSAAEYCHLYKHLPKLRGDLISLAACDHEFRRRHRIS
jgi:hypothetical protein